MKLEEIELLIKSTASNYLESENQWREFEKKYNNADTLEEKTKLIEEFKAKKSKSED